MITLEQINVVFDALKNDAEYQAIGPAIQRMATNALPAFISGVEKLWDEKLTFRNLFEAKVCWLEVMQLVHGPHPKREASIFAINLFLHDIQWALRFFECATEEGFFAKSKYGLPSSELFERYEAGQLTIGQLLLEKPYVVIGNVSFFE